MAASIAELSAKVDELQTALDEEQLAIQTAIGNLQASIDSLTAQIADGGTEAERQAVLDKLNLALSDLQSTVE